MKTLLIDDHILFATALQQLLRHGCGLKKVEHTDDALEALEIIKADPKIGLVLVDMNMPVVDGIDFLRALEHHHVDVLTGMITANEDPKLLREALRAGAKGIIPKHSTLEEMKQAISQITRGECYLPDYLRIKIDRLKLNKAASLAPTLSKQQQQILALLHKGHPEQRMATLLNINLTAVRNRIASLFQTLGVSTRSECLSHAQHQGLLEN
ncbi:MAG: response regulator transcription factor [Gammaproteobacteria bacterium]|nr:response regulator transcription factor [Gammaproteobacteria bacterium]